jgi:hypothetical protein
MRAHISFRFPTRSAAVAMLLLAACGENGSGQSAPAAVPTPEALASTLLKPGDIAGDWSLQSPSEVADEPDAGSKESDVMASGVVTDEARTMLPQMELCEAAGPDAQAAVAKLEWQAFRPLELAVDDAISPPDDRTGHMVFLQEFLMAGPADEIRATFDAVRDGMTACLGEIPAIDEGPGTAEAMAIPSVGDDRYGVLELIEEEGGWAEWRLHEVIVRKGPVLMSLNIVDIDAGVDPYFSASEIDQIVTTAVDRL